MQLQDYMRDIEAFFQSRSPVAVEGCLIGSLDTTWWPTKPGSGCPRWRCLS